VIEIKVVVEDEATVKVVVVGDDLSDVTKFQFENIENDYWNTKGS
jgi:hypothetical protein